MTPAAEPRLFARWRPPPRLLWAGLAVYIVLALAYNFIQPPFEPSDEQYQFGYVRYLIEQHTLPVARAGELSAYHHPPAYFVLAALLAWPFPAGDLAQYQINPYALFQHWEPGVDNKVLYLHGPWDAWPFHDTALAVHVARLVSLLMGAAAVLCTYQIARHLLDDYGAAAAALSAAGLPQFLSLSGALQNDAGATLLGALSLWLGLDYLTSGLTRRRALLLGALTGLAGLMKLSAAFMLVPAGAVILLWGLSSRQPLRQIIDRAAWLAAGVALVSGWWYARNIAVYGDPTAVNIVLVNYGGQSVAEGLRSWPTMLPYAWSTFWARIGHGDINLPGQVYTALAALTLAAFVGLAQRLRRLPAEQRWPVVIMFVTGLTAFAGLLYYLTINPTGGNSRYTFPALPAYMTLWIYGLTGLVPERARQTLALTLAAAMLLFGAAVLWFYVWPAYAPPPALAALPTDATPLDANLGNTVRLRGYALSAPSAAPGGHVYLTLYWEPLSLTDRPYSVYIHLQDERGNLIAQRDTYPGLGRYPTTAWTPGQLFADQYQVLIPATAAAPQTAHWKVGLWQAETGDYAFVLGADGQPVDSGLTFGAFAIQHDAP